MLGGWWDTSLETNRDISLDMELVVANVDGIAKFEEVVAV